MKLKSFLAATIALAGSTALAQADDDRWVTPTMIAARANMMSPELNYLTFQHMDSMFANRTAKASGQVWTLAAKSRDIGNDFVFEGKPVDLAGFMEKTATNALLVIKDGTVAAEIYRNGSSDKTRFISSSMAKSMLSTMVGIALSEGKIRSLDDKVIDYLPGWKASAYASVTIRDLLRMRSGVDWLEVYEFGSKTQLTEVHDNALVAYKYRWCDYARDRTKTAHGPGKVFNYSTLDTSVLGREFYGAGFNATLRDFGRFGLMMLNDGVANGKQVVPAAWVKESTTPAKDSEPASPQDFYGYAYQWWTVPDSDAYSAIGLFNQFIFVDPPSKTVIVKLDSPASPLGWEMDNTVFFQTIVATLAK